MHEKREFLSLIEHGEYFYTRKGIDISFDLGRAGVWEDDGPSTHATVIPVEDLDDPAWSKHMDDPDARWLRPLLARLRQGEDPERLRREAIQDYTAAHGTAPAVRMWTVTIA